MATEATERQLDILDAIRKLTEERGFPPTLPELSARLGMRAAGGAASGVTALVAKGLLDTQERTARCMRVSPAGLEALANRERARLHANQGAA